MKWRRFLVVKLVMAVIAGLLLPIVVATPGNSVGPGDVDTGLLLWLDASDPDNDGDDGNNPFDGQVATSWMDKSGNFNDANVLALHGSPTYRTASTINDIPAFRFNGLGYTEFRSEPNGPDWDPDCESSDTDFDTPDCQYSISREGDVFEIPNVDIRAGSRPDITIFSVYRATSVVDGDYFGVWGQDDTGWDRFFIASGYQGAENGVVGLGPVQEGYRIDGAGNGETRLVTTVYDGDTSGGGNSGPIDGSKVYFDGALVEEFTDSTDPWNAQSTFRVGFDGDDWHFNGDIAEIIIYDRVLSDSEITNVSTYLADKYGISLAPSVTTSAASAITRTTATLNGVVNAHNDTTTELTIRYATTSAGVASGTSPTVAPTSVSGSNDVSVSASITGLSANTTYFFRVSATNANGTDFGEILSFTTSAEDVVSSCAGAGAILNGSFENTGTRSYLADTSPNDWNTTALATRNNSNQVAAPFTKAVIELAGSNSGAAAGVTAYAGNMLSEIAADNGGDGNTGNGVRQGLYQDVNTLVGSRVFWSYWHHFRSGLTSANQVSRFRAAPTPSGTPSGNVWNATEQANPFGSGVTATIDTTHPVGPTSGWQQSSGQFEPTSTSTRFLFSNDTSPAPGYGNLIDDVRFTTYSACPISVRIVAGRASNFQIRNVEQDDSTTKILGSTFRYYGPAGAQIDTVSAVSTGLTVSVSNVANTSSTFALSASSVGTYSLNYRVSYTFSGTTYTSTSTLTVEVVPEVTARFPSEVPFDPTLTIKSLPGIRFNSATNAYVCFDQVANRSGGSISPTTVSVGQRSLASGVSLVSSGPPLIDSGTVGALTNQSRLVRITSNSGVLGRGGSKFLRVRASSIDNTDGVAPSCANGISFVVEFKTIKMTQTRRYVVPLKNGRQQN